MYCEDLVILQRLRKPIYAVDRNDVPHDDVLDVRAVRVVAPMAQPGTRNRARCARVWRRRRCGVEPRRELRHAARTVHVGEGLRQLRVRFLGIEDGV